MDGNIPSEYLGPKMLALPEGPRRNFAFLMGCGETNASQAAEDAGYSDHPGTRRVTAHTLMHDPKVLDAIREVAGNVLMSLAPLAVKRAKDILNDPKHYYHGRMIETTLDRSGFSAKTEHTVKVEHRIDTTELEALARRLALENGIAPERFIGVNGLGGSGDSRQKVIEHQPVEEVNGVSRETVNDDS